ncbi:protein-disulfide reductase DsbD family protein [Sphingomonas sp.]|jgi:thiol:disulfide interchange protein|uniref:protein-disulfide reductase DsbD family protein n=1 Tax=Sphingomonas sp. TaxID=28214 RepID=UPI002E30EC10|nr:protein-disulfide reductase DsbD domain-containing protein [Sphingomonas sp.]HEX4693209.1 protein-disulfide reductase DsbD domain-containing protein [Sphingomonas sp.]
MRALSFIVVTMMLALSAWAAPARAQGSPDDPPPHLRIAMVAESDTPKAGGTVTLALETKPQPGWHGYWQNPGDSGFATKFDWTLPGGMTAGEPVYPAPQRLLVSGLMSYVFERPYAPLVTLTVPAGLAVGTKLPIKLHLTYLVCTASLCVPENADLTTELAVGDGAIDPATRAQFDGWRRALPRSLGATATYQVAGGTMRIAIPYPATAAGAGAYFYPLAKDTIDDAAPQAVARDGDRLIVTTKPKGATGPIDGVLTVDGRALSVRAVPGTVAAIVPSGGLSAILLAFAGALLGGLILNVMPCVFPILGLKALSLARAGDEARARGEALAYTGGAVAVCLALGGAILALRAAGSAVGWAFQLQDPRVVVLLLLLTVGISLNFAGAFELPTPKFAARGGGAGAFATGALAAFVATPCTGPFMGAALGAALVLPWIAALAVFAGLGLGLALPFLLLGFVPAVRRKLPRPGAWMDTLRRVLSIPMWMTAVALAWLLGRQAGVDGMALALLAALGFGIVLWAVGRKQASGLAIGVPAIAMLLLIAGAAVWLERPMPKAPASDQAFSEAKLASLRAQNRPVFAYFTADWCLTCKVNERVAIDNAGVQAAFAKNNVAVLVGDWTDGDPVLGRFIEAHNRAGVPLYLYYPAGGGEPRVLPQVLTPSMLKQL